PPVIRVVHRSAPDHGDVIDLQPDVAAVGPYAREDLDGVAVAAVEVDGELRPRAERHEVRFADHRSIGRTGTEEAGVAVHRRAHPSGQPVLRARLDADVLPDVAP